MEAEKALKAQVRWAALRLALGPSYWRALELSQRSIRLLNRFYETVDLLSYLCNREISR